MWKWLGVAELHLYNIELQSEDLPSPSPLSPSLAHCSTPLRNKHCLMLQNTDSNNKTYISKHSKNTRTHDLPIFPQRGLSGSQSTKCQGIFIESCQVKLRQPEKENMLVYWKCWNFIWLVNHVHTSHRNFHTSKWSVVRLNVCCVYARDCELDWLFKRSVGLNFRLLLNALQWPWSLTLRCSLNGMLQWLTVKQYQCQK